MRAVLPGTMKRQLRDQFGGLCAAFGFLTGFPLPGSSAAAAENLGRALPFFPLVGLALGGLLVSLDHFLGRMLARPLLDFILLAMLVLASGGLHFDGLIDTADGLLGPGPAERRLASMRESSAGPRGGAAGMGQLLLQYGALAALPSSERVPALLLAPMLGRWAVVYGYVIFPYARRTPAMTDSGRLSGASLALKLGATPAVGAAATLLVLLSGALISWPSALLLLLLAWLVATLVGELARSRLGGMSGDVYGAVEQVVETLTLLLLPLLSNILIGRPPIGHGP
jgi:adenosylcobinamide-GDP ribazoletransferase